MGDRERIAEAMWNRLEELLVPDDRHGRIPWEEGNSFLRDRMREQADAALAVLSTPEGEGWQGIDPNWKETAFPAEQQPDQVEAERRRLEDEYNRGYNQGFADARS